jgi:Rad3-related DNA helicase
VGAAETDPLTRLAQVVTELAQAREAILRQAAALDLLRTQTQAELAASEQRTQRLVASWQTTQPSRGDDRFDVIDFKSASPTAFSGRREESWKKWSRQFRTYCNARKDGFRAALVWAEQSQVEINHNTIDSMGWAQARVADSKLYDFLLLTTHEDALVLVEHYEGMGF